MPRASTTRAAGRVKVAADGQDIFALDQHVTGVEIAEFGVQAQHDAALQQGAVSRVGLGAFQPIERRARAGGHGLPGEQLTGDAECGASGEQATSRRPSRMAACLVHLGRPRLAIIV
jgi:hypothetical protein